MGLALVWARQYNGLALSNASPIKLKMDIASNLHVLGTFYLAILNRAEKLPIGFWIRNNFIKK